MLDVNKGKFILKDPFELEENHSRKFFNPQILLTNDIFLDYTVWTNACPVNSNLFAAGGEGKCISIYDKRDSKIVKVFSDIHSGK